MESVQHQPPPDGGEYINNQWGVDLGGMHHHSASGHHSQQSSQDFGLYGFVESPQLPPDATFRMQSGAPGPSPYYAQVPQWSFPQPEHHYIPNQNTMPIHPGRQVPPITTHLPHPPTVSTSTPRRTLTDMDRRKMCIYHEENPTVKQTEIGAMFGVERSTVSKVLRQKDKYLHPEDGTKSPIKRTKGKVPDIERALTNWAKNAKKSGQHISDAAIREKAKYFAQNCGVSESHFKTNPTWLEKFKMKNNLHRHNSTDSDRGMSPIRHHSRSASLQSLPATVVASPMSGSRSQDSAGKESPDSYMEFNFKGFQPSTSSSLASIYTDSNGGSHSFTSPTSPVFSPTDSPLFPSQQARLPPIQQRPRAQSFPLVSPDPQHVSPTSGEHRQITRTSTMASSTSLSNSSIPEEGSLDEDIKPSRQSSISNPSLIYKKVNPSKEDARHALELVMSFLKQQPIGCVEADDFATVGKLLDRFGFGNSVASDNLPDAHNTNYRLAQDQVATEITTSH